MANTNAPFGLREFTGTVGGVAPNFSLITRQIAYNDTTKIYRGDPVASLVTGYVAQWTASTAVSQLAGVFFGCKYKSTAFGRTVWMPYWPGSDVASTDTVEAYLIPCNLAAPPVFIIQTNVTGVTIADIGANFDVALGTGSTATGQSGAYLDVSTINTTATLPFRLLGLWSDYAPPSSAGAQAGAYNWAIVAANVAGAGSTGLTT